MNARFEAKLGMYYTVLALPTSAVDYFAANVEKPIIGQIINQLIGPVGDIYTCMMTTESSTAGITANKMALRRDMEHKAAGIAAMVYAYAINQDPVLTELAETMSQWKVKSAFTILKDNITNVKAQIIRDTIAALSPTQITALENSYGLQPDGVDPLLDPGTITKLQMAMDAYYAVLAAPESAIENRKGANMVMDVRFEEADARLNALDAVVYDFQFHDDLWRFYFDYKAARTILDPVTTHTGIKGTITDADTELPIQGAKVTATAAGGTDQISEFSDIDGNYTVLTPKFKDNPYNIFIEKSGYQTVQIGETFVERGKKTTRNVLMLTLP